MQKKIFSPEQQTLIRLLRETRLEAKLRQEQVAERLGRPQSFVSKYEGGERRLDVLELRDVCSALGTTLPDFARLLESALVRGKRG